MASTQEDKIDVNDFESLAIHKMTADEKRQYRELGKQMFGSLNFKGREIIDENDDPDEVRAFVVRQLDDGIHPSIMEEGEVKVMESNYGVNWYEKWGYVEGDLTEIVTVDRN